MYVYECREAKEGGDVVHVIPGRPYKEGAGACVCKSQGGRGKRVLVGMWVGGSAEGKAQGRRAWVSACLCLNTGRLD